jgi:hypothetical protein
MRHLLIRFPLHGSEIDSRVHNLNGLDFPQSMNPMCNDELSIVPYPAIKGRSTNGAGAHSKLQKISPCAWLAMMASAKGPIAIGILLALLLLFASFANQSAEQFSEVGVDIQHLPAGPV